MVHQRLLEMLTGLFRRLPLQRQQDNSTRKWLAVRADRNGASVLPWQQLTIYVWQLHRASPWQAGYDRPDRAGTDAV